MKWERIAKAYNITTKKDDRLDNINNQTDTNSFQTILISQKACSKDQHGTKKSVSNK